MRRTPALSLALTLCLLGWLPLSAPAQTPRLAAFTLDCFVPTTPGYHTRATLLATFTLANRTVGHVASCADGPSDTTWPTFTTADGPVQNLQLIVVSVLEDAQHQFVASNYCQTYSLHGYMTFRCLADDQQGGEVNVLVSIAP